MDGRKRKLRVAMIGYQFMGRAHSNAWRQVGRFFDLPYEPVMKVVCGRNEAEVGQAIHASATARRNRAAA
jgi:predicted dehydrogenase